MGHHFSEYVELVDLVTLGVKESLVQSVASMVSEMSLDSCKVQFTSRYSHVCAAELCRVTMVTFLSSLSS